MAHGVFSCIESAYQATVHVERKIFFKNFNDQYNGVGFCPSGSFVTDSLKAVGFRIPYLSLISSIEADQRVVGSSFEHHAT